MNNSRKTKPQLIKELEALQTRVAELERVESQRKQAEKALQKSEMRFRDLFDEAPVAYHEIDTDARITRVNGTELNLLGYTAEEMVGRPIWDFVLEKETAREAIMAKLAGALSPGRAFERTYLRKDGTTVAVLIQDRFLRDPTGRITGVRSTMQDITDRKRVQDALKDSQALYSSLVENLPQCVFRKDLEGKFTFGNGKFCETLGRPLAEIIGKTDLDFYPKELAEKYRQDDHKVIEVGQLFETIEEHQPPGGEKIYVQVVKTPLHDATGKAIGMQGIFWDVTDRKRAEEALTYERNLLHALLDNVPDGIYFKDAKSRFIRISKALATRFGLDDPAQAAGKTDFDFFTDEHAEPAYADEREVIKSGRPLVGMEEKETWPNGRETWVSTTKVPLRDKEGNIIGTFGISRDITERKRTEERVKHLNAVLRAIRNVNQLITREKNRDRLLQGACNSLIETRGYQSVWIALLDESGELVTSTEAGLGEHFLPMVERLQRGELPDCARTALVHSGVVVTKDRSSACGGCPLSLIYRGNAAMTVRLEHNQEVYGVLCVSVPKDASTDEEEQTLFGEVVGDIAFALHSIELEEEGKRAEAALKDYSQRLEEMVEQRTQELRDAQDQLIRKERLAVLGQMAGGVGHELRNPLGVISNAVYFLRTTLSDANETTKEYLDIVSSEVRNAERIVSDLLDLSRTKTPERQEVSVADLINEVLEKQPPPEGVEVTIGIPSDLSGVFVDPRQIGQVLVNLVTNTYQAMPEGGRLTVSAHAESGQVHVSVTDTGCGISQENMKKVFEPLFTTKARGIGLGLPVSKNLVEANGGSIQVESSVNVGSTFTVILPTKEKGA